MVTKKDNLITIELPQNGYLIMEQDLFVTQWNKGQKLAISGITDGTEVEFGNEVVKETLRRTIIDGVVAIPDIMLTYTETIFAYVEVITADSQTTRYKIIITVEEKTKPSDYIYPDYEPTFREEMQALLDKKQDKLVAGNNITINENNVISATGGGTGGNGTTNYNNLENIPTVNGTEVKGNLTLEELGLYSRTEIDTKLGTKITLYTGTTAPSSSPSAYPDFVEPSLYFDKSTKKLYRLSSTGNSISYHEFAFSYNYYTKAEINSMLDALSSLNFEIVRSLPTENISTTTIYLVLKSTDNDINFYNEYIYIADRWEIIGTTEVDLSNYPTFEEMETAIENSIGDINTVLATLVDVESEVE